MFTRHDLVETGPRFDRLGSSERINSGIDRMLTRKPVLTFLVSNVLLMGRPQALHLQKFDLSVGEKPSYT
jgi:hypothetical protein